MPVRSWIILGVVMSLNLVLHFTLTWMAGRGRIAVRIFLRVAAVLFMTLSIFAELITILVIADNAISFKLYVLWPLYEYYFSPTEDTISLSLPIDLALLAVSFVLAFPASWIIKRLYRLILPRRDEIPEVANYFE